MATETIPGMILRGAAGHPLYGKDGTILFSTPITMSINVVISWSGGKDLDICAFYSHGGGSVGFGHDSSIEVGDGFTASHGGDNTSGGPETVSLAYSGSNGLKGKSFEIHANWYSVGKDSDGNELPGGGGPATVTATDSEGTSKSYTITPGTSKGRGAQPGDPGVRINFNNDGTIKDITAA